MSITKVINKINLDSIWKSVYEYTWYLVTFVLIIVLPIILGTAEADWQSYWITTTASIAGITSVFLVAKLNRWNMPFGVVETVLWTTSFIMWGAYAMAATYIITCLYVIFSFFSWRKNKNIDSKKETDAMNDSFSFQQWIKLISIGFLIWIFMFTTLVLSSPDVINSIPSHIYGDATSSTIMLLGVYLMYKRRKEQWYLWIAFNLSMIIWMSYEYSLSPDNTTLISIILFVSYLINAIYGMIRWQISSNKIHLPKTSKPKTTTHNHVFKVS